MYKPYGNRCVVRIIKHYLFEDKKPVLAEDGSQLYEPEPEAKVLVSNIDGIKKGMTIVPILRGGVPIRMTDCKKSYDIILDEEDIYGIKEQ
jgi:hypothetical protein